MRWKLSGWDTGGGLTSGKGRLPLANRPGGINRGGLSGGGGGGAIHAGSSHALSGPEGCS